MTQNTDISLYMFRHHLRHLQGATHQDLNFTEVLCITKVIHTLLQFFVRLMSSYKFLN